MKCQFLACMAVGLLVAADAHDDKPKTDADRVEGTWVLIAVEEAGERLEIPAEAQHKRVVISGDMIDTYWMNTCECGRYKLAPAESGIDIVACGRGRENAPPLKCLYRLDGDSLTLAVSYFDEGKRPGGFETTPRNRVVVQTYQRRKPGEAGISGVEEEQKKLEGTWQVVSEVEDGRTLRADEDEYRFEGETITEVRDGRERDGSSYFLDPNYLPKHGTFMSDGDVAFASIYKFEGNKLTICTDMRGKGRPTDFTAEAGSGRRLAVLKRIRR